MQLRECSVCDEWGELGRGRGHTPLVTLRKIGGGSCEELALRQIHSGHVVAEAHLTVVRAMGRRNGEVQIGAEMRKCRGNAFFESMETHISVHRAQTAERGGGSHAPAQKTP